MKYNAYKELKKLNKLHEDRWSTAKNNQEADELRSKYWELERNLRGQALSRGDFEVYKPDDRDPGPDIVSPRYNQEEQKQLDDAWAEVERATREASERLKAHQQDLANKRAAKLGLTGDQLVEFEKIKHQISSLNSKIKSNTYTINDLTKQNADLGKEVEDLMVKLNSIKG